MRAPPPLTAEASAVGVGEPDNACAHAVARGPTVDPMLTWLGLRASRAVDGRFLDQRVRGGEAVEHQPFDLFVAGETERLRRQILRLGASSLAQQRFDERDLSRRHRKRAQPEAEENPRVDRVPEVV